MTGGTSRGNSSTIRHSWRLSATCEDKDVLDAGCGEGYNTRILARGGARMTGVDLSERMIELAQAEERRAPLGIRYVVHATPISADFPTRASTPSSRSWP